MDEAALCSPTSCGCGLAVEPMGGVEAATLAAVAKALGDPHRVQIVHLLAVAGDAVCVVDIQRHLDVGQSTVSYHLRTLLDAGLVTKETRGRWSFYRLVPEHLEGIAAAIEGLGAAPVVT